MAAAMEEDEPVDRIWPELRTATDLLLMVSCCTAQATRRSLGLAFSGARSLWWALSGLLDKEKGSIMKFPVATEGLYEREAIAGLQEPACEGNGVPLFKEVVSPRPQKPWSQQYS